MPGAVGSRQPELQRRQSRQAQRRAQPQGTRQAATIVPAARAAIRHPNRELSARRDGRARPRLRDGVGAEPAAHLRVDFGIRPDRPGTRTRAASISSRRACRGIMSITGEPGGPPVKAGVPLTDLGAGLFALVGILARARTRASGPVAGSTWTRRWWTPASRCRCGKRPSIFSGPGCALPRSDPRIG